MSCKEFPGKSSHNEISVVGVTVLRRPYRTADRILRYGVRYREPSPKRSTVRNDFLAVQYGHTTPSRVPYSIILYGVWGLRLTLGVTYRIQEPFDRHIMLIVSSYAAIRHTSQRLGVQQRAEHRLLLLLLPATATSVQGAVTVAPTFRHNRK